MEEREKKRERLGNEERSMKDEENIPTAFLFLDGDARASAKEGKECRG